VVTSVVSGLTEPLAAGVLAAGRQAKWERERKFGTIWDAVDWLHKNRPDIAKTLDEPYKPRR
jgi:hypothetical protein